VAGVDPRSPGPADRGWDPHPRSPANRGSGSGSGVPCPGMRGNCAVSMPSMSSGLSLSNRPICSTQRHSACSPPRKSGMGMGMDPRSPANRGRWWGRAPDPGKSGLGPPPPIPGKSGIGIGDRGFRALVALSPGHGPLLTVGAVGFWGALAASS
jgi:hypothetical protein